MAKAHVSSFSRRSGRAVSRLLATAGPNHGARLEIRPRCRYAGTLVDLPGQAAGKSLRSPADIKRSCQDAPPRHPRSRKAARRLRHARRRSTATARAALALRIPSAVLSCSFGSHVRSTRQVDQQGPVCARYQRAARHRCQRALSPRRGGPSNRQAVPWPPSCTGVLAPVRPTLLSPSSSAAHQSRRPPAYQFRMRDAWPIHHEGCLPSRARVARASATRRGSRLPPCRSRREHVYSGQGMGKLLAPLLINLH